MEAIISPAIDNREDTPANGIAGLKHWKQDIPAALVVALVSVPLSLGIAIASGAPAICGLTSEIVAGLIFPFIGGAYVTISGPAAGLAPVLYSSIVTLGHGDMQVGYHLVTAAILLAGITQIILTWLNCARFSYLFPSAAIQGMLSSIGFMLIAKQIPNFIGHPFKAHEFFGMIAEAPSEFIQLHPQVFAISSICLILLFLLPRFKIRWLNVIPPQLVVVLLGTLLASSWHLDQKFLVSVPDNPLAHGIVFPDFKALFSDPSLIGSIIVAVLSLTFVDGTESLATVMAVDKIDPFRRKSSPDRTLFAMGISNICSSLIGGLTIIPGIIKSTTCIVSGGRTAWVNFYNALFITSFLLIGGHMIKMIPVAALSAVLVHIGWKLAGPHKWRHIRSIGNEQLLVYVATILVTVSTDLLLGILAGICLKVAVLIYYNFRAEQSFGLSSIARLFANPVASSIETDNFTEIHLSGPLVCFNSLAVRKAFDQALLRRKPIDLTLAPSVTVIDHSTSSFLESYRETCQRLGLALTITGADELRSGSQRPESLKYRSKPKDHSVFGWKVLLAVDDTEHSQEAVHEVISTPWTDRSELFVATAIQLPFAMAPSAQHEAKAKQMVDDTAKRVRDANPAFTSSNTLVLKGDVIAGIQSIVQEHHIDMLVVGTRKQQNLSKLLFGSVAHALLLSAHCSIHICRPRKSEQGNIVMLAVDDRKSSRYALEQASQRPWPDRTEFLCVTAIPTITESFYAVPNAYEIDELEINRRRQVEIAERTLKEAVEILLAEVPGCTASFRILNGDPSQALLKAANDEQVDLILLGSAGKGFAQRLIVGSVSESVAVLSDCSVEVISQRNNGQKQLSGIKNETQKSRVPAGI
jgi:MFS superfamily sulfate permease-like transporter